MKTALLSLPFVLLVGSIHAQDACQDNADCQNGGSCVSDAASGVFHSNEGGGGQYCKCINGYTGPQCAIYCPLECQNGGTCEYTPTEHSSTPLFSDYECKCRSQFKGTLCEIPYIECPDGLQCLNGAGCKISDDNDDADRVTYSCVCQDSHEGTFCEQLRAAAQKETHPSNSNKVSPGGIAAIVLVVVSVVGVLGVALLVMRRNKKNVPPTVMTSDGNIDADGSGTMANLDKSDVVAENGQTLTSTEDQII
jgi:hypothetical protein